MSRAYPYKAWVLQPSGKPKEIELVRECYGRSSFFGFWERSSTGKNYRVEEIHSDAGSAIASGLAALEVQQAKLTKQQANLDKKRETLLAARS